MTAHFSAYLDLVRIACALLVVLSHLGHGHLVGGYLWIFTKVGNEAVMAFFVLSGFIIAFVSDERETTVQKFVTARLARLYSVVVPAMALTFVMDNIGMSYNPVSYEQVRAFSSHEPMMAYMLSFLMLSESWGLHAHFGSNGAYWSIPYEFWYYMLFAAWAYFNGVRRIFLMGAAALLAGFEIVSLLPVWLTGVMLYRFRAIRPPAWVSAMAAMGGAVALGSLSWLEFSQHGKTTSIGMVPNGLLWQYATGACVAIHLFGMMRYSEWLYPNMVRWRRPLQRLAGSTLALYLFHLPVVAALQAIFDDSERDALRVLALLVAPIALSLTFGHWCERQKTRLRETLVKFAR